MSHIIYRLANGQRIPSVTTVLGILAKPALLEWAYQCGLDGVDYKQIRDDSAGVGTLAHSLIVSDLLSKDNSTEGYAEKDVKLAQRCRLSFREWTGGRTFKNILVETPLVSEKFCFGGTPDWFGEIDGVSTLLDFKTSGAIYPEYFHQVAAYRQLLVEAGHKVEVIKILRLPKSEVEVAEERTLKNLDAHWKIFLACLSIYQLQKEAKK